MEFQKMVAQQQAQADAKYAAEVRTAMAGEQQGVENDMAAQRMQLAAQGQAVDQEQRAEAARISAGQHAAQTAAVEQKAAGETAQHQAALTYLEGNPDAKARYMATGKLEPMVTPERTAQLGLSQEQEARRALTETISILQRQIQAQERTVKGLAVKDVWDNPMPPTEPAKLAQYDAAAKMMSLYQQQLDSLLPGLTGGKPAVSPAAIKQMVQQGQGPAVQGQAAQPAPSGGTATISTAAEYNELPNLAVYIWGPTGQQYTKGK
jgi:hypothetical protein